MKKIELSGKNGKGLFLLVDDDDYDELSKFDWYLTSRGYPTAVVKAHHLVLGMTKRDGTNVVDHKNGDRLDARKSNLRVTTHQRNLQNRKIDKRNKSGFKGVVERSKKLFKRYTATIGAGRTGKQIHIGYFKTPEDAARAYDSKAKELYGEFAKLNFPEES